MTTSDLMRAASLAAVLLAGSCAAPMNEMNDRTAFSDPTANHPITVEPAYRTLKVAFSDQAAGLSPEEASRFSGFVEDYISRGNGAITISAMRGPGSSEAIDYFGRELVKMGVPRERILVGTHDEPSSDARVELGYIAYVPHTDACGDWSKNAEEDAANLPMPDFGCSNQHNIAAMVADPRDLAQTRPLEPADPTRRTGVIQNYEQGKPTAAVKTPDQSGAVSDVNKQ
jgi:pilus assembly protein CpaD